MSGGDTDRIGDGARGATRFHREALAALIVLVAVVLGSIFLATDRGARWLVAPQTGRDLAARLEGGSVLRDGSPLRDGGRLRIGDERGRRSTARLPLIELEAGRIYLLVVGAAPGGGFTVQGFDRRSKQRVYLRFPPRRKTAWYVRRIGFGSEPAELRLTLVAPRHDSLELEEMTLWRLSPWRLRLAAALPWLGLVAFFGFVWRHRGRLAAALERPTPGDDRVLAGILFVVLSWAFLAAPVQQVMDGRLSTLVSYSLLHDGTVAVPREYVPIDLAEYRLEKLDARLYHYAYTPVAILNTPFVGLFELLGVSPMRGGVFDAAAEIGILRWIAALLAAALCAVLYRLGRLWLRPPMAIGLTLVFAFGTQIFSTISRPYWSHAWAALLTAGAIYLLLAPRFRDSRPAVSSALLLLGVSVLCRPVMVLSVGGGLALLWIAPRSRRRWLGLGCAAAALLVATPGLVSDLDHLVIPQEIDPFVAPTESWVLQRLVLGLAGTLISPARGLLLFVPFFAWIAWIAWSRRQDLAWPGVAAVAASVVVAHWLVLVITRVWPDGQAFGPRLFSDVVVWFYLLGALAVRSVLQLPRGGRRRLAVGTAVVCVAASLFVNVRGATAPATWHWHWLDRPPGWMIEGRRTALVPWVVWNWRNPQFLAGLLEPGPAVETDSEPLRDRRQLR